MAAGGCKVSRGDEKEWEGVDTTGQAMLGMCATIALQLSLTQSSSATHRLGLHFPSMPTCCSMETLQTAFGGWRDGAVSKVLANTRS